jgi:hypothetical protein
MISPSPRTPLAGRQAPSRGCHSTRSGFVRPPSWGWLPIEENTYIIVYIYSFVSDGVVTRFVIDVDGWVFIAMPNGIKPE